MCEIVKMMLGLFANPVSIECISGHRALPRDTNSLARRQTGVASKTQGIECVQHSAKEARRQKAIVIAIRSCDLDELATRLSSGKHDDGRAIFTTFLMTREMLVVPKVSVGNDKTCFRPRDRHRTS